MAGRKITTKHLNEEVFVAWNGPEIQHCDNALPGALNRYFGGKEWHFITSRVVKVHTISQAVDSIENASNVFNDESINMECSP